MSLRLERCALLAAGFAAHLEQLSKPDFIRAWCASTDIYPGLHPDGYDNAESGWPRVLQRFAAEAWQRNEVGELLDEEMYPCDAAWSGIYDDSASPLPKKTSAVSKSPRIMARVPMPDVADGGPHRSGV